MDCLDFRVLFVHGDGAIGALEVIVKRIADEHAFFGGELGGGGGRCHV